MQRATFSPLRSVHASPSSIAIGVSIFTLPCVVHDREIVACDPQAERQRIARAIVRVLTHQQVPDSSGRKGGVKSTSGMLGRDSQQCQEMSRFSGPKEIGTASCTVAVFAGKGGSSCIAAKSSSLRNLYRTARQPTSARRSCGCEWFVAICAEWPAYGFFN